ncbi:MAG TPA: hypothetical protein DIU05_00945 [Bacteroidetes bacterium]|jgi:hypothetical protein|nr:hypothetical protein [Bacteroidota bacterium]
MLSRWTDFLTSDGEKECRNRESEFEAKDESVEGLCWNCIFKALEHLNDNDLGIITTRNELQSSAEANNRQIAHYVYHVGQIVYLAKAIQSLQWETLYYC